MSEVMPESKNYLSTSTEIRVTYAEVDRMGVAYYGNYMRWFEIGRAEYLRARGKSYREIEEQGYILPVYEAYARYRESALYDDLLEIQTIPLEIGRARIKFGYQILRKTDATLLADGYTVHPCMGATTKRVGRFPPDLIQLIEQAPLV